MKKIIFILFIFCIILSIYLITKDTKIYYLSLGDELKIGNNKVEYSYVNYIGEYLNKNKKLEKVVNGYYNDNIRTIDLINMINDNKKISVNGKNITIQNSLIKADIVTLSIGSNDLISKLSLYEVYNDNEIYNYIDDYLIDLECLLQLMRKYCKEKIIFIGYYNIFNNSDLDKYYKYLINKVIKLTDKYNINYVDIYKEFDNLEYRSKFLFPSKAGYTYIGQEIIKIINK